jgi:hypothetical protein
MHWSYVKTFFDICGFDYSTLEEFLNVNEELKVMKPPTIKDYEWDDTLTVQVHFDTGYINVDKLCKDNGKTEKGFLNYITDHNILEAYHKKDNNEEFTGDYLKLRSEFIADNLHKNSTTWISERMLPVLMMYCNPHYVVFVSDIMLMYHKDPMKFTVTGLAEYNRQNDTDTSATFKSTPKDKPEEAAKNYKNDMEHMIKDSKGKDENIVFQDENKNKQSEKEFRESNAKYIHSLKGRIRKITYEKETLIKDNQSLSEQFAPVRALMNDHPGTNVGQLALTRKAMLDKNIYPLEKELIEKDTTIKTLQEQLQVERKEKEELYDELSITQGTMDEEARDKDEYIEHLESGYAPKKGKKKSGKAEVNDAKAFRPEAKFELEDFENHGITSAAPPGSCSHLSVYTKRDYDGKNMLAFVPGRSTNYKGLNFVSRGIIKLDEKKTTEQYLELFAKSNRNAYIKYEGLTFTLDPSHTAESFERLFCKGVSDHVVSKHTATEYKIGNKDAVCAY